MLSQDNKTIEDDIEFFEEPTTPKKIERSVTFDDLNPLREAIINLDNKANKISSKYEKIEKGIKNQEAELKKQKKNFNNQKEIINDQKNDIKAIKADLENQTNRIPEIVGLFSAIIAIVLIDVSVIKSAQSFLGAILLIISLTCSIAIFAVLIHSFFSPDDKSEFGKSFWVPISILIIFVIIGGATYFTGNDLYKFLEK